MSIFTARPKTAPVLTLATLTALALIGATTAAHAGFEWKGPAAAPKKPAPAITTTVGSTATGDMAGLEPVISWNGEVSETAMPAQKVDEVDVTAIITATPPAHVEAAPAEIAQEEIVVETPMMTLLPATQAPQVSEAAAPVVAEGADVVSGFGADLPLVIALQQVVPVGYQYSFASGVNPGVSVSWDGGKVWQHVLSDMLAPQGLGYKVNNNTVVIGQFTSPTVTTAPTRVLLSTSPEAPAYVPTKADQLPEDLGAPAAPAAAPVLDTSHTTTLPAPSDAPVYIRREKPSTLLKKSSADDVAKTTEATAAVEAPVATETVVAATEVPAAPVANETPASKWIEPTTPVALSAAVEPAANTATVVEAAPVAVPAIPVAGISTGQWHASKGDTLRDALKKWSDTAGVELYWSIDYDFRLDGDVDYSGNYDEAVTKALDRFASARPQPYGQLHQSSEGPRVLVVKSYDLTH